MIWQSEIQDLVGWSEFFKFHVIPNQTALGKSIDLLMKLSTVIHSL